MHLSVFYVRVVDVRIKYIPQNKRLVMLSLSTGFQLGLIEAMNIISQFLYAFTH